MHKGFAAAGAIFGAITVALGAFGAHALKKTFGPEELAIFETGVKYQFYHTLGLFVVSFAYRDLKASMVEWAGRLFIAGIIIFSGSLYLLASARAAGSTSYNWLGAITPFGGTAFIAGWLCLFYSFVRHR